MPAVSSASTIAFLIDSTAVSRLTTRPRRIPSDSATPIPTTCRPPSDGSATMAVVFDVPTSRPTRYRSLRATPPPASPVNRRRSRLLPRRSVIRHVRRASPRDAGAGPPPPATRRTRARRTGGPRSPPRAPTRGSSPRGRSTTAAARRSRSSPEPQPRGVAVDDHDGVVRIRHVHLRDPLRDVRLRPQVREAACAASRGPAFVQFRLPCRAPRRGRRGSAGPGRCSAGRTRRSTRHGRPPGRTPRRSGRSQSGIAPSRRPRSWTAASAAASRPPPTGTRARARATPRDPR